MDKVWLFFGRTGRTVTIAFLQDKLIDKVLDHQYQTKDPQDIHDNIVFVLKTITKQRPSQEDDVLHIVEKEDPDTVDLS